MIALPDPITRDDLSQWLHGGVCMARRDTDQPWQTAVLDRTVGEEALAECAVMRFEDDNFAQEADVALCNIRAHWPVCGSINIPKYRFAVHVERIPARQYKRTFSGRQAQIKVVRGWEVRKKFGVTMLERVVEFTPTVVCALFFPEYPPTLDDAIALLDEGHLSVALNQRVILAGDDNGKRAVYYRGELAATISGGVVSPVSGVMTTSIIRRYLGGRYQWA